MIKIEGISIDYETSEEEVIEEVEVLVEEKPEPVKKMRKKVNKIDIFGLKLTRRENHMYEECYKTLESQKVKNVLKPKTVVNFLKKSKLKNVQNLSFLFI